MALRYGIVQGRLSPQVGDFIQNFPTDWRDEFRIAERVGATHIEWIDGAPNDVIGNSKLIDLDVESLEVPISAICLDWMVTTRHTSQHDRFVDGLTLAMMAEQSMDLNINRLVLPLLESASLRDARELGILPEIGDQLDELCDLFPLVQFSVETDLDVVGMQELAERLGERRNFSVTFDTGNLTRLGYDLNAHIDTYGKIIDNVHIKDCMVGGTTVPLGTGDTDLAVVRRLVDLPGVDYITFQTARGPGDEIETFKRNVEIIERILHG